MNTFFHPAGNFYISIGTAFQIGDTQYPPNWIEFSTAEEIEAAGFVMVKVVGERADDRYYDNSEVLLADTLTISARLKPVEYLRTLKWGEIKAERDRRKSGGVKVGTKWFHTDDGSRIQQIGLVMMGATIPPGLQWKTLDGLFAVMTAELAMQIFTAVAANDQAVFVAAEMHRNAMENDVAPATYNWSLGWPKTFGEI